MLQVSLYSPNCYRLTVSKILSKFSMDLLDNDIEEIKNLMICRKDLACHPSRQSIISPKTVQLCTSETVSFRQKLCACTTHTCTVIHLKPFAFISCKDKGQTNKLTAPSNSNYVLTENLDKTSAYPQNRRCFELG